MQARQERQRSICFTTCADAAPAVLQHVLDQIDAAARAVELVAQQHIGRAGRVAEAAMDAGAQDRVRRRRVSGSASWARVKFVCIGQRLAIHAAAIEDALADRSCALTRAVSAASGAACGWNTGTAARSASRARTSVAWPPIAAPRGSPPRRHPRPADREPDEPAAPIEEISRVERARHGGGERRPGGRRHRDAPDRAIGERGERRDVAHRAPERRATPLRPTVSIAPKPASSRRSAAARATTDGTGPSSRSKVRAPSRRDRGGQMRRAADLVRAVERRAHRAARGLVVEADEQQACASPRAAAAP